MEEKNKNRQKYIKEEYEKNKQEDVINTIPKTRCKSAEVTQKSKNIIKKNEQKKLDLKTFTDYISPNLGFMSPIKNKISEFINGGIKKDEKKYERKENISKNMKEYQLRRERRESKKKESNNNKILPNVDNNNKNIEKIIL